MKILLHPDVLLSIVAFIGVILLSILYQKLMEPIRIKKEIEKRMKEIEKRKKEIEKRKKELEREARVGSFKGLEDVYEGIIFPWTYVLACIHNTLEEKPNHIPCLKCKIPSENLVWIQYMSPDFTWKNLAGRAGPLSLCPNCKTQIEFILEMMN